MKRALSIVAVTLMLCSLALGQGRRTQPVKSKVKSPGTDVCTAGTLPVLIADGSNNFGDIINNADFAYYTLNVFPGHSYVVEAWDPYDPISSTPKPLATVSLLQNDCTTPITTSDVAAFDPDISNGFGDRISWIQGGSSEATVVVKLANNDTVFAYSYWIRAIDTTLINPRWSTYGGATTQYSVVNNTGQVITGVITLTDFFPTQGVTHTANVTVPANGEAFLTAGPGGNPFNITDSRFGFGSIAYVGPAGSVTADAYGITGSGVIYLVIAPRNYQH